MNIPYIDVLCMALVSFWFSHIHKTQILSQIPAGQGQKPRTSYLSDAAVQKISLQ